MDVRGAQGLQRRRRILTAVVILVLWGLTTHGTHAGSGDEPHYLAIAHSLAFDFDVDLRNNYGDDEPLIGSGTLEAGLHTRPGVDGTLRPVHDLGLPLLLAPYVKVVRPIVSPLLGIPDHPLLKRLRLTPSTAYRHLLSAFMIIVAALLARQMLTTFHQVMPQPALAFWMALLVALSPPLLIFSILLFTELITALVCLILFRYLVLEDQPSPRRWAGAGAMVGFLLLLHVRNIGLVAVFAVFAISRLWKQRSPVGGAAFMTPLLLIAGVRVAFNHAFWGTYLTSPHARLGQSTGLDQHLYVTIHRAFAMLLDQEFGLLPYAPIFVLAPVGAVVLWRRFPALAWKLSAVVLCYLLPVWLPSSNVHGWTGGWNPAGRFLVPIIPLIGIAVYAAATAAPRAVLVPLLSFQVVANAYFWQNPKTLWNDGDGIAAVCEHHGAGACRLLPSFREL